MNKKTVRIPNITCKHCVATIRRELSELSGVKTVEGEATERRITVEWEAPASWEKIAGTLAEIGYPAEEE